VFNRTFLCLILLLVALSQAASAAPPAAVTRFIGQHCSECHDVEVKKGGLDLAGLAFEPANADSLARWVQVFDRVQAGEMPPKKKERPAAEAQVEFLTTLGGLLREADARRIAAAGRVPARRLTRYEYERTIHDLLGIDVPLAVLLPEDAQADGFDTVSSAQQISHFLLEKYLDAADVALDAAFAKALLPLEEHRRTFDWKAICRPSSRGREPEGRPEQQDAVAWATGEAFHGRMPPTAVPESGWYRVRLQVKAVNPPDHGYVWCTVQSGVCFAKAPVLHPVGDFAVTTNVSTHEFEAWIERGQILDVRPGDLTLKGISNRGKWADGAAEKAGTAGVAIKSLSVERIHRGLPTAEVRRVLFGSLPLGVLDPVPVETDRSNGSSTRRFSRSGSSVPQSPAEVVSANPKADAARLVHDFASRAFRRSVTADEARPYVAMAHSELAAGADFAAALRAAYRAILVSPRFFYLEEPAGRLDDHALASRLSYFLWSTMPDDELRALANAGKLHESATLRAQVERLLAHPKSAGFTENFLNQWLKLSEIDFTVPDTKLYPEFDETLKLAMLAETRAFFRELLERDLSVRNVVDSVFGVMNERLARHYGIAWPGGEGLRRVAFKPEDHRGGIITHGSVLKVTANGTTTSPVTRGVWMLERILGQEVPPVPANVPAIEPDIRGAQTIRDQLDKHRNVESCASCHVKIDPPGFALESYDVIGGWRDHYRAAKEGKGWNQGPAVDPSYTLADGRAFADLAGFKKLLLSDPDALARNLAAKLITYATGAGISFSDREVVEGIVARTRSTDHGLRSILHEVVQSRVFLNK